MSRKAADDELEKLWSGLEKDLVGSYSLFPDLPSSESGGREASWPDEDLGGFLSLADSLGVRLVYTDIDRLEDLDDRQARSYVGKIRAITLGFVFEGVLHVWSQEAEWWPELLAKLEPADDVGKETEKPRFSKVQIEQWARQLAEDPSFQQAKTTEGRKRIARSAIPEVHDAVGKGSHFADWEVANLGREIYLEDVQPRQDTAMANQAQAFLAEGLRKYEVAARLGIGMARLNRILAVGAMEESKARAPLGGEDERDD